MSRLPLIPILLALAVGMLTGSVAAARQGSFAVHRKVSATEQESDEGYLAVGAETMIVAKPQSPLHQWLRGQNNSRVRACIEADQSSQSGNRGVRTAGCRNRRRPG